MKKLFYTIIIQLLLTNSAFAQKETSNIKSNYYFTPYIGIFDVFDKKHFSMIGAELRAIPYYTYFIPKVGAYVTEKQSVYGYIGFNLDFPIYKNSLYFIPGFAVGTYSKGKKGKRLGGTLEFRSSLELAYKMSNSHRLGIALSHISNAGIYKRNPGAEDFVINYSFPF